jgi:gas vesicle protein GvpA/GvpJ/GvpM family
MAARQPKSSKARSRKTDDWLFPTFLNQSDVAIESSLLDVVDNVLNRGMLVHGDLILGVADVDLIYAKLSVLLAAFDKVTDEQIFRPISGRRKLKPKPKRRQ